MSVFSRYLATSILSGIGLALCVLISLDFFFTIVNEADDVGRQNYGWLQALGYLLLLLPGRSIEFFPAAVLIGSLLSLGNLASNNELVAIRAAGVSIGQIAWSVVRLGAVLMILLFVINEFVVPQTNKMAEQTKQQALGIAPSTLSSTWLRSGDYFIEVTQQLGQNHYGGVRLFEVSREPAITAIIDVDELRYIDNQWQATGVIHRQLQSDRIVISDQLNVDLDLSPRLLTVLNTDPETLSIIELQQYIDYLQLNRLDATLYKLTFWLKLAGPLTTLIMLLIALPFVFGFLRSINTGQLLLIGILLGLSFFIIIRISSYAGQIYGLNPLVSAFAPLIVFLALSLWGLRRVR